MSVTRSFYITLRIFFILFSFRFIRDAFYKWDGYSYYMRLTDFLPDLALSFIFWTLIGVIFALLFWIVLYGFSKITLGYLKVSFFEPVMVLLTFVIVVFFLKRTFLSISLSDLIGLSYITFLTLGGIFILTIFGLIFWLGRKYFNFEKILTGLNFRIAPLFWSFAVLLVLAVPLSLNKKDSVDLNSLGQIPAEMAQEEGVINGKFHSRKRPNIILVTMDALTARDMHVYGYHRLTTPFISEWAKDAIVFKRAYASSNWTTPTTMSLMTGQMPWTHRVWYMAIFHHLTGHKNNFPNILKGFGYNVYGFIQNYASKCIRDGESFFGKR